MGAMTAAQDSRAQFEAWAATRDGLKDKLERAPWPHGDEYNWSSAAWAWSMWQEFEERAALSAEPVAWEPVAELCAQMCDSRSRSLSKDGAHTAANEAAKCASVLRRPPDDWREKLAAAAPQPAAQGLAALTPAARDVLAERKRQIESEGWKTERDDVYDTGEMALAAACYAAHSASCAAIKAPHTAPGVFVRTRSAQDFVGEMWPWSDDWWKPSGHRRNLEKAGALVLAEIERIDRAALAAQAKHGEQQ